MVIKETRERLYNSITNKSCARQEDVTKIPCIDRNQYRGKLLSPKDFNSFSAKVRIIIELTKLFSKKV